MLEYFLIANVGKYATYSLFLYLFHFHSLSFLQTNHTVLTQGILFLSCSHYPVTFLLFNLSVFLFFSGFSPSSRSFFSLFLLILLLFFYFCHHMVSQLSLSSPPSYLPSSFSVFAIIFVLEIELSYLPVILGYVWTDTFTHTHARWVPPLLRNAHLNLRPSSFPPHFLTYSPPPSCSPTVFTSLPPASVFISSFSPSACRLSLIFLQCVTID